MAENIEVLYGAVNDIGVQDTDNNSYHGVILL